MFVCDLERVMRACSSCWLGEETERAVREDSHRREERKSSIFRLAREQGWTGSRVSTGC